MYSSFPAVEQDNKHYTLPKDSGALMVEVWIGTMALQNLQQYGCETGNKLNEKSLDLNRNSSRFLFQIKIGAVLLKSKQAVILIK